MRSSRVNSITYGALICALVGALLLVNRQFAGYFDVYMFWVIPLPVIVYSIKFGTKQTIVMSFAMVLLSFILGGFITTFYVVGSVVAGIVYGYGLSKGKSASFLIGSVIVISLIMMVITTIIFAKMFGYNSITEDIALFSEEFRNMFANFAQGNPAVEQSINQLLSTNTMATILIISSVLTSVMEGILVHLLAFLVLKRLKMTLPPMKPISTLFAPTWVKVFVFSAFLANLMANLTSISQYNDIMLPILIIAEIACFFYGYILLMTLVSIRMGNNKKGRGLLGLLTAVGALFFSPFIVFLGVIDIFTSFRKRIVLRGMGANEQ